MENYTIAVVGNPNCGKTTLFNALTGARQSVGNWPGVTVDCKKGSYSDGGWRVQVVDLPGTYSLAVIPGMEGVDERIARDYVLSGEADAVVNIVDASNLERNLYLTVQVRETSVPTVIALNMMDAAARNGIDIDVDKLADLLGCPVVPMVAALDEGLTELKDAIRRVAREGSRGSLAIEYGPEIDAAVNQIMAELDTGKAGIRWLPLQLLEGDMLAREMVGSAALNALVNRLSEGITDSLGKDPDVLIADARCGLAHTMVDTAVRRRGRLGRTVSDGIDRVVLHRWFGPAIFLAVMYLMFMFTINLAGAFIDFFDMAVGTILVDGGRFVLSAAGSPEWLTVLLANGIGGGIQVVATFVPIIGFLYLFLSMIEDSGYMARAAFLMDRFMRIVGLPGKAFVPLIVGFGCNVPAVVAARTLERQRDRVLTVVMTPFMSCGARLAVYALFAAAFFPVGGQNVVFALYLIGVAIAIGTGLLLKHTLLSGDSAPFIMELPPYHVPRPRGILIHAWIRLEMFITGAGKVIVVVVTVLSFLNSWGTDGTFGNENSDRSVLSAVGRAIVPVFEPMGIDEENWPAAVGIFTGVFAKETVVGALNALYSAMDDNAAMIEAHKTPEREFDLLGGLAEAVASIPTNLKKMGALLTDPLGLGIVGSGDLDTAAANQKVNKGTFGVMLERFDGKIGAFAYLLLILLYFPCVATLGAVNGELGARWTLFVGAWTTGIAYMTAVGFYQAGTLSRHPGQSVAWIIGLLATLACVVALMRFFGRRGDLLLSPASAE
jgi:ferrous iron transport protein B